MPNNQTTTGGYGGDKDPPNYYEVDWVKLIANGIPGAVAADILFPGSVRDIILMGGVGAITTQWVYVGRSSSQHRADDLTQKVPFLGLGVGYGLAKLTGLAGPQCMVVGILGGFAAYEFKRRYERHQGDKDTGEDVTQIKSQAKQYQATHKSPVSAPITQPGFAQSVGRMFSA